MALPCPLKAFSYEGWNEYSQLPLPLFNPGAECWHSTGKLHRRAINHPSYVPGVHQNPMLTQPLFKLFLNFRCMTEFHNFKFQGFPGPDLCCSSGTGSRQAFVHPAKKAVVLLCCRNQAPQLSALSLSESPLLCLPTAQHFGAIPLSYDINDPQTMLSFLGFCCFTT